MITIISSLCDKLSHRLPLAIRTHARKNARELKIITIWMKWKNSGDAEHLMISYRHIIEFYD